MSEEEMKALVEMNNVLKAKLEQQTKVYQQSLQEMQREIDDLQRNCDVFNEQMNDAVERAMELQKIVDALEMAKQNMPKGTKFVIVAEEDYLRNIGIINERSKLGE